ncbi:MAG: hypothetical protein M3R22_09695 [Pseudomonadota bacterium]|nr:hypothetical protein [Pseudomonadota bacterium]
MISLIRTASIMPGKGPDAWAFAHKVAAYWKKHFGHELELLRPIGGNPGRIAWSAHYDSLAAYEQVQARILQDKKYSTLLVAAGGLFVPGSLHDDIWQTV